jgi:hypothetical protein
VMAVTSISVAVSLLLVKEEKMGCASLETGTLLDGVSLERFSQDCGGRQLNRRTPASRPQSFKRQDTPGCGPTGG